MNRLAASTRRRTTPAVAVSLDLADDAQKRIHELIQRFHSGRWPLFCCLAIRQHNGSVYEAVQWLRAEPPLFAVVDYRQDGLGLSWRPYVSRHAALVALRGRRPA
ncbi:MAG: hypothetical protein JNJ46_24705 [Myxococcales bacterium]|nr:hypothetical protein [Myxococcales bacterium]